MRGIIFLSLALIGWLPSLAALELTLFASGDDSVTTVDAHLQGIDESIVLETLDKGGVVRATWVFRSRGADVSWQLSEVRMARKDPFETGYRLYDADTRPLDELQVGGAIVDSLTRLRGFPLPISSSFPIEGRCYVEYDVEIPPLGLRNLFNENRDRSAWIPIVLTAEDG